MTVRRITSDTRMGACAGYPASYTREQGGLTRLKLLMESLTRIFTLWWRRNLRKWDRTFFRSSTRSTSREPKILSS
jgi:hypothetical protein